MHYWPPIETYLSNWMLSFRLFSSIILLYSSIGKLYLFICRNTIIIIDIGWKMISFLKYHFTRRNELTIYIQVCLKGIWRWRKYDNIVTLKFRIISKDVVQLILLFGAEILVVTLLMGQALGGVTVPGGNLIDEKYPTEEAGQKVGVNLSWGRDIGGEVWDYVDLHSAKAWYGSTVYCNAIDSRAMWSGGE